MKYVKYIVQTALGLVLSFGIMSYRGLFNAEGGAEKFMIVSDGFTVTALLFLSVGFLTWTATTGFFDIFGFAIRKGAHALLPGLWQDSSGGYYEYKLKKQEERKTKGEKSTLLVGVGFLLLGLIMTALWYRT